MAATNSENSGNTLSRRQLMGWLSATGIGTAAFHRALTVQAASATEVTVEMVKQAEWVSGIELTDEQRKETATGLTRTLRDLEALRSYDVGYDTWPALKMHLLPEEQETEVRETTGEDQSNYQPQERPDNDEDLAFLPLRKQHDLLKRREISATYLTEVYLKRLKKFNPLLKFVVNFTEEAAMEKAKLLDAPRAIVNEHSIL